MCVQDEFEKINFFLFSFISTSKWNVFFVYTFLICAALSLNTLIFFILNITREVIYIIFNFCFCQKKLKKRQQSVLLFLSSFLLKKYNNLFMFF